MNPRLASTLLMLLLLGGCVGSSTMPDAAAPAAPTLTRAGEAPAGCAPAENCTSNQAGLRDGEIRISNCTIVQHAVVGPDAVLQPEYPTGTRPGIEGVTWFALAALMCEQATDASRTLEPFHLSVLGLSIDPPGESGQSANGWLVGMEMLTNSESLAAVLASSGWRATTSDEFSFDWTEPSPAPQDATPYQLDVPAPAPAYSAAGTFSSDTSGGRSLDTNLFIYAPAGAPLSVLKVAWTGTWIGNSEAATVSFGDDSYWAEQSWPAAWPATNFVEIQGSGVIQFEPLEKY